jgi:solute carrier family 8 (sodium/calcium exchanger)
VRGIFVTDDPSPKGLIMHVLTMPWKILFGIMPPPGFCGGWPCFVLSLVGIGFQVSHTRGRTLG